MENDLMDIRETPMTDRETNVIEPIPDEWIDRLFGCMSEFYGQSWEKHYLTDYKKALHKTIWKNGLHGLSYDQIKRALYHYRAQSKLDNDNPPIVTEFYQRAKNS